MSPSSSILNNWNGQEIKSVTEFTKSIKSLLNYMWLVNSVKYYFALNLVTQNYMSKKWPQTATLYGLKKGGHITVDLWKETHPQNSFGTTVVYSSRTEFVCRHVQRMTGCCWEFKCLQFSKTVKHFSRRKDVTCSNWQLPKTLLYFSFTVFAH